MGGDDPAVKAKAAEDKIKRQAAAKAIIEGEYKTVAAELADIKTIVAQTHLDALEAINTRIATTKPATKKRVVVEESESSSEEEVVVVRKKKSKVSHPLAPAPPPAPPAPAPAPVPEFPAKPVRRGPVLDRMLFTR